MDNKLQVGIYQGLEVPQSFRIYADNVQIHLSEDAVGMVPFTDKRSVPRSADVIWDIRSGGGNPPPDFLLDAGLPPLVVTVHGFAPVTLSGWEYFRTLKGLIMSSRYAKLKLARWHEAQSSIAAIIAVSAFVKDETIRYTKAAANKVHVCHHGVDNGVFMPRSGVEPEGYFLHISNDEPRKNIDRILQAFARLKLDNDVQLVLKLPKHTARRYAGIDGVRILTGVLATEELADLYRKALAFVFPSLYEGFGLPIVEAMACGCPVITSNVSACAEVAGGAATTIDPRDEEALFEAMLAICRDRHLRAERITAGLQRTQDFSWMKSAQCHANVLRNAACTGR